MLGSLKLFWQKRQNGVFDMQIPRITKGDKISWLTSLPSYLSPSTYTLSWALRGATVLNLTSTQEGDGTFKTEITAAQSGALTVGKYLWQAYATNEDDERTTIGQGRVTVKPNLFTVTAPYATATDAETMLAEVKTAINRVLEGQSYKIKDREMTRADLPELIKLRDKLKWEVANEKRKDDIANGLPDPSRIKIRFR